MSDFDKAQEELEKYQDNQQDLKDLEAKINKIKGQKLELNKQLKVLGFKNLRKAKDWVKMASEEIGRLAAKIRTTNEEIIKSIDELQEVLK